MPGQFRDLIVGVCDIMKQSNHFEIAAPFHDPGNVRGQSRDGPDREIARNFYRHTQN